VQFKLSIMLLIVLFIIVVFYFIFNHNLVKNEKNILRATLLFIINLSILIVIWKILEKLFIQYEVEVNKNIPFLIMCLLGAITGYMYRPLSMYNKLFKSKSNR